MPGAGDGATSPLALAFPRELHDPESLKRAAYRFSAQVAVEFVPSEREITCVLRPLRALSADDAVQMLNEFRIEVLDQDLRASIARETAATRTAILAYAFSRSGLQGE